MKYLDTYITLDAFRKQISEIWLKQFSENFNFAIRDSRTIPNICEIYSKYYQ